MEHLHVLLLEHSPDVYEYQVIRCENANLSTSSVDSAASLAIYFVKLL